MNRRTSSNSTTGSNLGAFSINKAVLYLVLAATLTCVTMIYIARRMQQRPNKVQAAVEALYQLMRENITGSAMEEKMAAKWFPFIGALFLFIMFSNLIGYIPLPTNTEHEISVFGTHIPSFSLYASTANIAIPLALALVVFVSYTFEGVRAKGPIGYLKGLIPGGVTGGMAVAIFFLEVLSNLMRILSLTIRLFANILAGHLIILFMAGALAVIWASPRWAGSRCRSASRCSPSRSAWSPPCRRSSSPRSPPSTSAARSPKITEDDPPPPHP